MGRTVVLSRDCKKASGLEMTISAASLFSLDLRAGNRNEVLIEGVFLG